MNTVGVPALLPDSDGTLTLTLKPGTGASNAYLNALVIEPIFADSTAPATPRNIAAALNSGQVQVSWTDAAYNEAGYEVWRATSQAGPYAALNAGATNANATSYMDATVSGSTTYYYTVRSINALGVSPFSDTVSITTANTAPILGSIANVTMIAQQVLDVPVTATDNAGDVVTLSSFGLPSFATFVDNGGGNGTLHFAPGYTLGTFTGVTIAATDNKGATSTKTFTVTVNPADPNAPTGLRAAGATSTSVVLKWVDNATTESGYEVWRSTTTVDSTFSLVASPAANTTTYTDGGVTAGILYYYKVRAKIDTSFTSYSNIAGASGVMSAVYVNFNDADAAPLPWNNTMGGPIDGDVYPLSNDLGNPSGENMTVIGKDFTGVNHTGMNTGNNSGIYPDNVMKQSWYTDAGAVGQVQMSGLNQSMSYTVTFFASRDGNGAYADRTTKFTAADKSVSINAINNISYTGQVVNIKPDENGAILLSVQSASASPYGYMNSVVIQGYMSDGVGAGNDSYASSDTIINNNRPAAVTPATTARSATSLSLDATTVEVTEKVTAYPNPFKDDVTLTISTQAAISKVGITVFDLSGRPVLVKEVSNVLQGTSQINVGLDSRLSPGVYLLQIRNGDNGKVQVIKLLRQ
jgi:hypothetical protein